MIRIPISDEKREEIEKIYWNWMSRYHLKDMIKVIKSDSVMDSLVLKPYMPEKEAVKNFLLADCNELEKIKEYLDINKCTISNATKKYILKRYCNFRDSQAAKIINVLGITVCPYCNQNHINIVHDKGGKLRFWGDLDHFHDKKTYPQLAVCLYNLIPVCKVCNQLKSFKSGEIVNPYDNDYKTEITFRTEFDDKVDIDYLYGKSQNFDIVIDEKSILQTDKEEIELFDLDNRYKNLKQNAQEIIIKSRAYDNLYQSQLKRNFGFDDESLKAAIFGYTDDHLNRVLSKFNLDIMSQFL